MSKAATSPAKKKGSENLPKPASSLSPSTEGKIGLALLALILLMVGIIRSHFKNIPFERDEGIYSYIGGMILEGKVPYKDFFEQKFPGLFYFYGLMVMLSGKTVAGLHSGFIVLNMVTIVIIYFAAKNLTSAYPAVVAAATFAFVSLTPNLSGFTIQAEHGVDIFICLGLLMYSLLRKSGLKRYIFLMGLAFGFAFMTKTSGVFLVLFGGVTVLIEFFTGPDRKNYKQLLIDVLNYSAGVLAVIVLFFGIILVKGSFNEMIFWAYEIPKYAYVNTVPFEDGIKYFKYARDAIVQNHKFFWIHGMLFLATCLVTTTTLRIKLVGIALMVFSFGTIVPGFYFYGHYWIQLIPGLSLISALTFQGIIDFISVKLNFKNPAIRLAYLSIFMLLVFGHIAGQKSYYFHPNFDQIMRSVYGDNPFPEAMEIGNYINRHAKPEDQIVIIGSEPEIYVYTQKKCPSRHAYFSALVSSLPQHKEWQREFIQDVEKAKPKYFVFFRHSISLLVQPNSDQHIFEWVNQYATSNYHIVGMIDMQPGQMSTYMWDEASRTYQPKGQNVIFVFERNT
jgi:hypothetical protein